MYGVISVNGDPATRIKAHRLKETEKAIYLDCEGDKHWIPKTLCKYDHNNGTVDIKDWYYKKIFPNG